MTALRTATACSALLLFNLSSAAGQIAAKATFVADGSFDLPPAGSTSPKNPAGTGCRRASFGCCP